jgi:signal transduction histidine kinase
VGTVTISSRELDDSWEVTVTDDGAGFSPDEPPDDGRPHVGLANVRERLRLVCNGDVRIESKPNQGSRVTIVVPKAKVGNR